CRAKDGATSSCRSRLTWSGWVRSSGCRAIDRSRLRFGTQAAKVESGSWPWSQKTKRNRDAAGRDAPYVDCASVQCQAAVDDGRHRSPLSIDRTADLEGRRGATRAPQASGAARRLASHRAVPARRRGPVVAPEVPDRVVDGSDHAWDADHAREEDLAEREVGV